MISTRKDFATLFSHKKVHPDLVSKQQNLVAFQTLAGERLDQLSKKEDQITNQIDTYIGEIIAQIKRKQEEFHQTVRQVIGVRKREVNRKVLKLKFEFILSKSLQRKNVIEKSEDFKFHVFSVSHTFKIYFNSCQSTQYLEKIA